ncbi:MAG: ABC transporter substrate-binding protein [Deltaproteobacteria bacterium]|nr:ABC transporter substrate-binding protein [Deltaproteobacteria bacterium]
MKKKKGKGITRRDFMKKVGKGTVAVGAASVLPHVVRPVRAAKRDYVLIGRPNPATGAIAAFGEGTPWVDDRVLDEINRKGGVYIQEYGKKVPIKVKIVDTQSDPTKAAEVASRLILHDKIDLMLVYHTPATVNPVTSVCERYKVPSISLDNPIEMWLTGGPYHWAFHAFWLVVEDGFPAYTGMWEQLQTNKIVGLIAGNDTDGISFAEGSHKLLPPLGYKVVDPGRFPLGNQDFSSVIDTLKKEKVDILFGNMIPPDFATAWRQCHRMGFKPKIATIGRATLFPKAVEAIGFDLPLGLSTEIWWSPYHPFKSSIAGYSCKKLCDDWSEASGKQWTQTLGFKYAGYEIAYDVLKRAQTLDREKLRRAIAATDLDTMVGHIKYNDKNYARTPLVAGQWVKGKRFPWDLMICYNGKHKNIPTQGRLFPIP